MREVITKKNRKIASCDSYLNMLCIVFYAMYSIHCILFIVSYALYCMHCILYIISYALYSIIVFYAWYSMHGIIGIVLYASYYMHCILCIGFYALYYNALYSINEKINESLDFVQRGGRGQSQSPIFSVLILVGLR